MNYKVCKFGGSSLADASGFIKVANIVKNDITRKIIVVSAPGKRHQQDHKVTDLLIQYAEQSFHGFNTNELLEEILLRYYEIIDQLNLSPQGKDIIKKLILQRGSKESDYDSYLDAIKSLGEEICAKLFSEYLVSIGEDFEYMDPQDAGLILTSEPGNAQVNHGSYEMLAKLRTHSSRIVMPGFYGYSAEGKITAFSRGGSDITGAILASAVNADIYENFTDVDFVYAADPRIVENPRPIRKITYLEMRELSYSGFNVLHDEALEPVYRTGIPVHIKNFKNPGGDGTLICNQRETTKNPIIGISGSNGFTTLLVEKYLMNRIKGFGRRLLQIIEECGLSYEHCPSGIDSISVILRSEDLSDTKEKNVLERIKNELQPDNLSLRRNISLVMIVGNGMIKNIGFANRATSVCSQKRINLLMINQGSSENSIMFGVDDRERELLIQSLHSEFFNKK